jgi:hypothetical protein
MGPVKPDYAREVRASLTDPRKLCDALGLTKGAERQAAGLLVACPAHGERTPSCSVTRGRDGTIRVRCFGCDWTGDALTLVAVVHNLDVRNDFREVLLEAAGIAGLHHVVDELRGKAEWKPRPAPIMPEPLPDVDYPPAEEVSDVWEASDFASRDAVASEYLKGRRLSPEDASQLGLLRVLPPATEVPITLPSWAHYGSLSWQRSGHRMVVPVYDHTGTMRSLRAWRIEGDAPAKRVPPVRCKATGLLMANSGALQILRDRCAPRRVLVVEGEPDFTTAAIRWHDLAIFGVINGGWSEEFAKRVPLGSEVIVATHHDTAGEKYAALVASTVKTRAVVLRSAA